MSPIHLFCLAMAGTKQFPSQSSVYVVRHLLPKTMTMLNTSHSSPTPSSRLSEITGLITKIYSRMMWHRIAAEWCRWKCHQGRLFVPPVKWFADAAVACLPTVLVHTTYVLISVLAFTL